MSNDTTTTKPAFTAATNSYEPADLDPFDTLDIDGRNVHVSAFQTATPHLSVDVHAPETVRAQEVTTQSGVSIGITVKNAAGISTTITLFDVSRDQLVAALNDAWIVGR